MAHQALYRRYRSQRFSEVKGQEQVTTALRNAVAEGRVGHAYLFSGPRGTGKTSTARILAKALNCEDLQDGEPCGVCEACVSMQAGTSYDLQELDAASKSKVDDVRALIESVALGSPGRTKVYILDEVHMLSAGASNALLKTLEEPPDHVVFVLATTDPQKVLPTIRSRTQHYEFHLLPADVLGDHVRWVISDAGLDVTEADVEHVLRAGGGSARDTLSALDQAVAGGVSTEGDHAEALAEAVVAVDTAAALTVVAEATSAGPRPPGAGRGPAGPPARRLPAPHGRPPGAPLGPRPGAGRGLVGPHRRPGHHPGPGGGGRGPPGHAPGPRPPHPIGGGPGPPHPHRLGRHRRRRPRRPRRPGGAPRAGRAPGARGPGPRCARRSRAGGDRRPAACGPAVGANREPEAPPGAGSRRTRRPHRPGRGARRPGRPRRGGIPAGRTPGLDARAPAPVTGPASLARAAPGEPHRGAGSLRVRGGRPARRRAPSRRPPCRRGPIDPAPGARGPCGSVGGGAGGHVDRRGGAPAQGHGQGPYTQGRVVAADDRSVTVGLPDPVHLERCEQKRPEAEEALAAALGRPVRLALVVAGDDVGGGRPSSGSSPARPPAEEAVEDIDLDTLVDAPTENRSGVDRVTEAFPGAQVVEP